MMSAVKSLHSAPVQLYVHCTHQALLSEATTAQTGIEQALSMAAYNSCLSPPRWLQGKGDFNNGQSSLLLSVN